jgi:serpin B
MLILVSALGLALPFVAGTPPEVQSVASANNRFALDLYARLRSPDGNLFFSPYSVHKTLTMAYAGARGDTAREMAAVLHFPSGQGDPHRAYREARKLLNQKAAQRGVQLALSANLWGQRGYRFEKSFLNLLQECYGAGLQEVDFTAPEAARQTINAWVGKQTNQKIRELFPEGALNLTTRLVLASAIYFKGDWAQPFKKSGTRDDTFWLDARTRAQVPMMNQTDVVGYCEDGQVQVLELPYVGRGLAMVVLLPRQRDGLPELEKSLTAEKLAAWAGRLRAQKVEVSLPRFKLTGAFSLGDTLAALGMKRAFVSGAADFGGMNGGRESLFITAVMHRAFVEVNEEGTEAAAATGAAVGSLSMEPRAAVPVFRADHPFVFAVRDVRTGVLLFLGRVARP